MRETIIAIASFAGSAVLTALAVLVPPQSGLWLAVLYGGICVLFLCGIALLVDIIRRRQRTNMTPAEIGFNGALVTAAVSTIAAIKHYPRIAVIAAILAWIGIGVDYWLGPPRAFIFSQGNRLMQGTGGPIGWLPHAQAADPGNKQTRYFLLEMVGTNQSEEEIGLDDAYFVSGITGAQVHLKVQMPNKSAAVSEINPIPPKASVSLFTELSPPNGITADDFLKVWGPFSFVATYGGKTQRIEINRELAIQLVTQPSATPWPRVTLKHSTGN